jgi:hypothetical protein
MGIFNYVDYKMNCPECFHLITDFQTKDESIVSLCMETVSLNQISRFHGSCNNCGLWINFVLKRPLKITIDDFEMQTGRYRSVEEHRKMQEQNKKHLKDLFG